MFSNYTESSYFHVSFPLALPISLIFPGCLTISAINITIKRLIEIDVAPFKRCYFDGVIL